MTTTPNAPPPKSLSPAAEAVLDAYWETFNAPLEGAIHRPLAAAFCAVADQCKIEWNYHPDYPETESVIIVSELLAIATELKNQTMTDPTPDFRAELQLLFDAIDSKSVYVLGHNSRLIESINRARAALATPPPEPPTDDELNELWNCCGDHDEGGGHYGNIFQFARAVIDRWGK